MNQERFAKNIRKAYEREHESPKMGLAVFAAVLLVFLGFLTLGVVKATHIAGSVVESVVIPK